MQRLGNVWAAQQGRHEMPVPWKSLPLCKNILPPRHFSSTEMCSPAVWTLLHLIIPVTPDVPSQPQSALGHKSMFPIRSAEFMMVFRIVCYLSWMTSTPGAGARHPVSSRLVSRRHPQVTTIVMTQLARSQLALQFGPLQVPSCPLRAAAEGTVKMHGEQWGRKVTNPFCKLRRRAASGASPNPGQGFWKQPRGCTSATCRLLPSRRCPF